jgi:hypothetical protein
MFEFKPTAGAFGAEPDLDVTSQSGARQMKATMAGGG